MPRKKRKRKEEAIGSARGGQTQCATGSMFRFPVDADLCIVCHRVCQGSPGVLTFKKRYSTVGRQLTSMFWGLPPSNPKLRRITSLARALASAPAALTQTALRWPRCYLRCCAGWPQRRCRPPGSSLALPWGAGSQAALQTLARRGSRRRSAWHPPSGCVPHVRKGEGRPIEARQVVGVWRGQRLHHQDRHAHAKQLDFQSNHVTRRAAPSTEGINTVVHRAGTRDGRIMPNRRPPDSLLRRTWTPISGWRPA